MHGFEVRFNVYAESQQEADNASQIIKQFVNDMAMKGIAVTASKISSAVSRWKNNVFVTNYFK